jgi:diacylglycerol O-acyltransferase / wax synthase
MRRLSSVDAAWYRVGRDARNPADIVGVLFFDGEVDYARLRERLESTLFARPRFEQRVRARALAAPRWVREQDPSHAGHFSQRRLSAPGGHAELLALIDALMNEPLDAQRSPWRMCVIDGYAGGSVLVGQLHHCMGDGFALMRLLLSAADAEPQAAAPRAPTKPAAGLVQRSWHAARHLPRAVRDLWHILSLPFDPATRFRGALGGRRAVAWSSAFELVRVKSLAHAYGATINDILLAVLAGALRQYLQEHGEPPHTFRAIVPVNLRPSAAPVDEIHGNWFGLVFVELPIAEQDRHARLRTLKADIDRIKASDEPLVALGILAAMGRMPAVAERVIEYLFARKATVVVTNVPGPRQPLWLAGQRVRDVLFWVPHPCGLACGISILSYAGRVRVGVRSDLAVVADPQRIAELFDQELRAWEGSGA